MNSPENMLIDFKVRERQERGVGGERGQGEGAGWETSMRKRTLNGRLPYVLQLRIKPAT